MPVTLLARINRAMETGGYAASESSPPSSKWPSNAEGAVLFLGVCCQLLGGSNIYIYDICIYIYVIYIYVYIHTLYRFTACWGLLGLPHYINVK